jgi:hypothetical protein
MIHKRKINEGSKLKKSRKVLPLVICHQHCIAVTCVVPVTETAAVAVVVVVVVVVGGGGGAKGGFEAHQLPKLLVPISQFKHIQ